MKKACCANGADQVSWKPNRPTSTERRKPTVLLIAGVLLVVAYISAPAPKGAPAVQSTGAPQSGNPYHHLELHVLSDGVDGVPGCDDQRHQQGLGYTHFDRMNGRFDTGDVAQTRPRRSRLRCRPGRTTTSATSTSTWWVR
jgi:hypothetical protein